MLDMPVLYCGYSELPLSPVRLGDSDLPYGRWPVSAAPQGFFYLLVFRFPDRRVFLHRDSVYSRGATVLPYTLPCFQDVASGQYLFHQAARVFHSPSPFLRRSRLLRHASWHSDSPGGCLRGFTLSSLSGAFRSSFPEGWLSSAYLRSSVPRRVPSFPFGPSPLSGYYDLC